MRLPCVVLAVVVSLTASAVGKTSLEFGSTGNLAAINRDDHKSVYGFSAYLLKPVSATAGLKLEYAYYVSRFTYYGYLSVGLPWEPNHFDTWDDVDKRETFHLFSFGFLRTISYAEITFLSVGAGLIYGRYDADVRGIRSGITENPSARAVMGASLEASLLVNQLLGLRNTVMRFGFRHRFMGVMRGGIGSGASGSDDYRFTELSVGFGYQFGGRRNGP